MIDMSSSTDLLALISQYTELKRTGNTNGGEYHGACPGCGGRDRFMVWPTEGRYYCRQCQATGDAIEFVRWRHGLTFPAALKHLGTAWHLDRREQRFRATARTVRPQTVPPVALTDPAWQQHAAEFTAIAQQTLWGARGTTALRYLRTRGLTDAVVKAAGLGLNPSDRQESWSRHLQEDVWLPGGIVIPWTIGDLIYRINIRRLEKGAKPKYIGPKGYAQALYGSIGLMPGTIALLVEGEFDTLAVRSVNPQVALPLIPIATGGTGNAQQDKWIVWLSRAERILVAFDTDPAGEKAAEWWIHTLGPRAIRLKPTRHDVNEMVQFGDDLTVWINASLKPTE